MLRLSSAPPLRSLRLCGERNFLNELIEAQMQPGLLDPLIPLFPYSPFFPFHLSSVKIPYP
jgi:hypothetical protein